MISVDEGIRDKRSQSYAERSFKVKRAESISSKLRSVYGPLPSRDGAKLLRPIARGSARALSCFDCSGFECFCSRRY
jgi:hypothetical protein